MRSTISRKLALFTVVLVPAFLAGAALRGQESEDMPKGGALRQFSSPLPQPAGPTPVPRGLWPGQPGRPSYDYSWGYPTPWYIYQTRPYKMPAPLYDPPKLGLHYLYPYGYQFGIQIPPDSDQPVYYFSDEVPGGPQRFAMTPAVMEGIKLLKAGRYAAAGRAFARELRDEDAPPELYLLIAAALLGAEKPVDASLVFQHAVEIAPSLDFLERTDLSAKFPSPKALLDKRGGASRLLQATILILSGNKEEGMAVLREEADKDKAAKRIYLHFIGSVFGEEAGKEEPKQGREKLAPAPPPEEKPLPKEEKKA